MIIGYSLSLLLKFSFFISFVSTQDLSNVTLSMKYSQSKNFITIQLLQNNSPNQTFFSPFTTYFSLVSVGSNVTIYSQGFSTTPYNFFSPYFQFSGQSLQQIQIDAAILDTRIRNFTVQVQIYSSANLFPYYSQFLKKVTGTFQVQCPMNWLSIVPDMNVYSDDTQLVPFYQPISQFSIYLISQNNCNQSGITNTISKVQWSHNLTNYAFTDLFALSLDTMTATSLQNVQNIIPSNNPYLQVKVNVQYQNKINQTAYINISYAYLQINGIQQTQFQQNQVLGQTLNLDLSNLQSSLQFYNLLFYIVCPSQLFASLSQYNNICTFNQSQLLQGQQNQQSNGIFQLNALQQQGLNIITNIQYNFTIEALINGTGISQKFNFTVTFYQDGTGKNVACPRIQTDYISYLVDRSQLYYYPFFNNTAYLIVFPNLYYYCSNQFYNIQSISWQTQDLISGQQFQFLQYPNITALQRYALVTPQNTNNILAGSIFITTIQINSTNLQTNQKSSISYTFNITFKQYPLQPNINAFQDLNQNIQIDNHNTLPYLAEYLVLSAASSYDPDNYSQDSNLTFIWTCPQFITNYSGIPCQTFVSGDRNQTLMISAFQRANISFDFNLDYPFTLQVSNPLNPYKLPQQYTMFIAFQQPLKNDFQNNFYMPSQCGENMFVNSSSQAQQIQGYPFEYQGSQYSKVLVFDKINYTNAYFYVTFNNNPKNNNNQNCKNSQISSQIMLMYMFDGLQDSDSPPLLIFNQSYNPSQNQNIKNSSSLFVNLDLDISNINLNIYYQVGIYYFTQRFNSVHISLSIDVFYLYRQWAPLYANITQIPPVYVDKYDSLYLDASNSFDQEGLDFSFLYQWTCPSGNTSSKTNNSTTLPQCGVQQKQYNINLSYQDRYKTNIDNVNVNYNYSLTIYDPALLANGKMRQSPSKNIQVVVTQQSDYSNCVSVDFNNGNILGYNQQMNRTLFIQYNQVVGVNPQLFLTNLCQNVYLMNNNAWSQYQQQSNSQDQTIFTQNSTYNQYRNNTPSIYTIYQQVISILMINNANQFKVAYYYRIQFQQNFYMGYDAATVFNQGTYMNVYYVPPDLIPMISSPQIQTFLPQNQNTIQIDASNSIDPLGLPFTCVWNCPKYFGGSKCSSNCVLNLVKDNLKQYASPQSVAFYYGQSHLFQVFISSSDGTRTASYSQYLYLGDPTIQVLTDDVSDCGIIQLNSYQTSNNSIITNQWNLYQIYTFTCQQNNTFQYQQQQQQPPPSNNNNNSTNNKGNKIMIQLNTNSIDQIIKANNADFGFNNVPYLNQDSDFFILGDKLIIKPYAICKFQTLNVQYLTISLNFGSQISTYPMNQNFEAQPVSLIRGQISLLRPPNSQDIQQLITNTQQNYYSSQFNLSFSGFDTVQHTGMLFQMRAHIPLYQTYQKIIGVKPFTSESQILYYYNITIPQVDGILFDFFDLNFQYIGSYDVLNAPESPFTLQYNPSFYTQNYYQSQLFAITKKVYKNYYNSNWVQQLNQQGDLQQPNIFLNYQGMNLVSLELDFKRLQELSELLQSSLINQLNSVQLSNYTSTILTYLFSNYWQFQSYFNKTLSISPSQQQQIPLYILQDLSNQIDFKTILILQNIIRTSTNLQTQFQPTIQLLMNISYNFQEYFIQDGQNNIDLIGQAIINIIENLKYLTMNLNPKSYNIASMTQQLNQIENFFIKLVIQNMNDCNTFSYTYKQANRVIYALPQSINYASIYQLVNITRTKAQNSKEIVSLVNEGIFIQNGANVIDVTFNTQANISSPASSIVQIYANDSLGNSITNFNISNGQALAQINIQVQAYYMQMFKNSFNNNSLQFYYQPMCVYVNQQAILSSDGIQQLFYDFNSGIMSCLTSHFSTFTIDYVIVQKQTGTPTQSTNNQSTDIGDNSHVNISNIQITVQNSNNLTFLQTQKFFENHYYGYIWSIIIVTLLEIFTIIIVSQITKKKKYNSKNNIQSIDILKNAGVCQIYWICLYIYHSLLFLVKLNNKKQIKYTLMMLNKMILFWIHLFLISTIICKVVNRNTDKDNKKLIILTFIIVVFIIRPIFYTIFNCILFPGKSYQVISPQKQYSQNQQQDQTNIQLKNSQIQQQQQQQNQYPQQQTNGTIITRGQIENNNNFLKQNQNEQIKLQQIQIVVDQKKIERFSDQELIKQYSSIDREVGFFSEIEDDGGDQPQNNNLQEFFNKQNKQKTIIGSNFKPIKNQQSNDQLDINQIQVEEVKQINNLEDGIFRQSSGNQLILSSDASSQNSQRNQNNFITNQQEISKNKMQNIDIIDGWQIMNENDNQIQKQQTVDSNFGLMNDNNAKSEIINNNIQMNISKPVVLEEKNYQCKEILLTYFLLLTLLALNAATFYIMYSLEDKKSVHSWISMTFGIFLFIIFVSDTFFLLIFSIFFKNLSQDSLLMTLFGFIFVQNGHRKSLYQSIINEL